MQQRLVLLPFRTARRTNSWSSATLQPAHTMQVQGGSTTAIKPCPSQPPLTGSTECWTIWNCLAGLGVTTKSPAQQLFQHTLCSTQDKGSSSLICLSAWEPPSGPVQGAHTPSSFLNPKILPHGIKNSQSLPNTQCQCCPKPHCLLWPYPLTEKPSKPCCRQMALLNDFTALLSDNCFL